MQSTYIEFPEKGKVVVLNEDINTGDLKPMEVVVRNEASIISAGTELACLHGMEAGVAFPMRPGYGSIGRIIAKGPAISDFNIGDRVFYAGRHASVQRFTHGENHQWAYLFPVPEDIDAVDATVGCMAQIAMTAPNVTDLALNDTVAVFGLGLVGILAAMLYQLRGARVIAVDPQAERGALARKMGIGNIIDVPAAEQVQAVKDATGGEGARVTVDATGVSQVVVNCVRATALFGQVVLLGSPRAPFESNVTEVLSPIHSNGLVVRGAHMWRYPVRADRNQRLSVTWAFETVFDLIASGKLPVRELISHVIKPENAPEAYEGLMYKRSEYTGAVIDWR